MLPYNNNRKLNPKKKKIIWKMLKHLGKVGK